MGTELRSDDSHNISYPPTPDTRGTARIYHLRKPYYLGNHDSPLSYVMFGLWKQRLLEKGEPPTTASIREQAEAFLGIAATPKKRALGICLMAGALTLTTLIGAIVGSSFRSTPEVVNVDGLALSTNEIEFIRGVRNGNTTLQENRNANSPRESVEALALAKGQVSKDEVLRRIRGN